jgi:hypothetical protein
VVDARRAGARGAERCDREIGQEGGRLGRGDDERLARPRPAVVRDYLRISATA